MMERPDKETFTVHRLFDIAPFKEAVLLGGRSGLEKAISRVNVMEVPDVVDWVRPGEFLMTTGYPFKDSLEVLISLIADLAHKGVAALGIKTKRFIDHVPDAAIAAADHYGLPLIELPPDTAFSDVVREVMEHVLISESRYLSILQARVQRLSNVLLHGDGLHAFLSHLQAMIQNPVILMTASDELLYSPAAAALCSNVPASEWDRLRTNQSLEMNVLQWNAHTCPVHLSAVPGGQLDTDLLLVLESDSEYGIVDSLTVNWAGKLLGFEISNMQARQNIEAKYFDQFLQDWLSGRIVADVDLRLRAEACGWPLATEAIYLVGLVSFHDAAKPQLKVLLDHLRRLNWEHPTASGKTHIRWTLMEGELVFLLALQGPEQALTELAASAAAKIQALHDQPLSICLGRPVHEKERVASSYIDARRTVEISKVCKLSGPIHRYSELGAYLLLYRLQGTRELEEYKQMYLEPLLELDRKQSSALLYTLRTYFQCNCNAKETAEQMFVHYNTIIYRLERIKAALGMRLDDPETKLLLQLAIKSYEISNSAAHITE